jgi:hypothetical protein
MNALQCISWGGRRWKAPKGIALLPARGSGDQALARAVDARVGPYLAQLPPPPMPSKKNNKKRSTNAAAFSGTTDATDKTANG